MSTFTKTVEDIDTIENELKSLTSSASSLPSVSGSDINPAFTKTQSVHDASARLASLLTTSSDVMNKYQLKAKETDPNRIIYGAAMIQRINQQNERIQKLKAEFDPINQTISERYAVAKTAKDTNDKRIAEETAARHRAEEEARLKAKADAEAAAAAEAEARAAAEAKKKEDARLAVEKAAADKKAATAAAAQAARTAKEAEAKRVREETEKRSAAAAEKAKSDESARRVTEAEDAKKPLLVRSRDQLTHAFTLLSQSCLHESDHKIALQILARFVDNILKEPTNQSRLKISIKNPIVAQRLISKNGGKQALTAIGFTPTINTDGKPSDDELSIKATEEQWTVLLNTQKLITAEIERAKLPQFDPTVMQSNFAKLLIDPFFTALRTAKPAFVTTINTYVKDGGIPQTAKIIQIIAEHVGTDNNLSQLMIESPAIKQLLAETGVKDVMRKERGWKLSSATVNKLLEEQSTSSTITPTSTPTPAAPIPIPAPSSTSVPMEEDLDEDAILQQAIAMSMEQEQPKPDDKKDDKPK